MGVSREQPACSWIEKKIRAYFRTRQFAPLVPYSRIHNRTGKGSVGKAKKDFARSALSESRCDRIYADRGLVFLVAIGGRNLCAAHPPHASTRLC
jgi:hypothetical protein